MPFQNSVRGSYGAQGSFNGSGNLQNYQVLNMSNWQATGNTGTVSTSGSGTTSVTVVQAGGSLGPWNRGSNSQTFSPPFTVEMVKTGPVTDDQSSYAMCGIVPSGKLSAMRSDASNSYQYGYLWYPTTTDSQANCYETPASNSGTTGQANYPLGSWTSGSTFRISVDSSGTIKYFNGTGGSPARTVTGMSGYTWAVSVSLYSISGVNSGFSGIRLNQGALWNPSTQKYYAG